jgi:hypothetical protein
MKIRGVLANTVCASLLALNVGSADVNEPDAVKSKVNLKLLDSKSSVTPTNNNYFTILRTFYGAIWQQKFMGDLLISGYANQPYVTGLTPTGTNAILPAFIIHDTSANTLNEKGRITLPAGEGILSVSISPVNDRPYLVLSKITSSQTTTFPGSIVPVGPYNYTLELYSYNPDGTINPGPLDSLIWGVDYNPPGINTSIITYNAAVNFSHDGKYLFYTYTSGSPGALSQHLGTFEIASNGTFNNTPVAENPLPVGPIVGIDNFFPQPDIKTFIHPNNSTHYKTVAGLVGFTPGNPTGGNTQAGMVNSYNFDPVAGTFILTGSQPVPASMRGIDLHPHGDRVAVITANADENGISVARIPRLPFSGDIPDKGKQLRVYDFDQDASANALTYVWGHDFGSAAGFHLQFSRDGDFLALTLSPQQAMTSIPVPFPPPTGPMTVFPGFGPSVLATFAFKKASYQFVMQDMQPASFVSSGLAWNADDTRLATNGQPSPTLHDIQLYQVQHSE